MDTPLVELEARARELLPAPVYEYYRQGAADEVSAFEAVDAWRRFRFLPHVLRDVSAVSVTTTLLGRQLDTPVAIAPTALQRHAHPRGEQEMAAGAAAAGSLICVSSNTGLPYATIGLTGAPWWAQVYVLQDRSLTTAMLQLAVSAGASAVVLTADTPVVGAKRNAGETVWEMTPEGYSHVNVDRAGVTTQALEKALDLTPEVIGWIRDRTGLPVVVKGVLRADDASRAVDAGADAVWVSNHGGRQLDRSISTAQALGPVAAAVRDHAEVYVDGGLRDGRDVLTALALGARGVFVGRPALWALTTEGADGVRRVLDDITRDLVQAMCLAGCSSLSEVDAELLSGLNRTTAT